MLHHARVPTPVDEQGVVRDLDAVHAIQDAITAEQDRPGTFEVPNWDPVTLTVVRDTLLRVAPALADMPGGSFGLPDEVNPVRHLIVTAGGWGGNPERDAKYVAVFPEHNDGITAYQLTVRDVPVDGFWSVSVYNEAGFFAPNPEQKYSLNSVTASSVTASRGEDGSVTIRFGGPDRTAANRLPIVAGWDYVVRLCRPRREILDGSWTFPAAEAIPG